MLDNSENTREKIGHSKLSRRFYGFLISDYWRILRPTFICPAALCFVIIWIASAVYLLVVGYGLWVFKCFILLTIVTFFIVLTAALTEKRTKETPVTGWLRIKLWLQVSVIFFVIVITGYQGAMYHGVFEKIPIPVWSKLIRFFGQFGEKYLDSDIVGNGFLAVANPISYFIIPFVLLILLGAKFHQLGFKKGHRTWRVLVIWCLLPIIVIILYIFTGNLTLSRLWKRLLSNLLQNGFAEEFLFRGALQTRLTKLLSPSWAIVIQALVFGVWHLGVGFRETEGKGILAAFASSIICQGIAGLAFGIIFQRTRNLLGCTTFHVISNSVFF